MLKLKMIFFNNDTSMGQRKILSPRRESNPWPQPCQTHVEVIIHISNCNCIHKTTGMCNVYLGFRSGTAPFYNAHLSVTNKLESSHLCCCNRERILVPIALFALLADGALARETRGSKDKGFPFPDSGTSGLRVCSREVSLYCMAESWRFLL